MLSKLLNKARARAARLFEAPEALEARIAPATLVSPHIVTYTDTHGDHVTIYSSAAVFTNSSVANTILAFSTGSVSGSNTTQQDLTALDLTGLTSTVAGDNLSITVAKSKTGTDLAVGSIVSPYALGHVTVQGDLDSITAGISTAGSAHYIGLTSLSVASLGVHSTGASMMSTIYGGAGSIKVAGNADAVVLDIVSNVTSGASNANLGSISIGGALTGGSASNSGSLQVGGKIGSVKIGGALTSGSGSGSGAIVAGGTVGSISMGSLITAPNGAVAEVSVGGSLGSITFSGPATSGSPADTGLVTVAGSVGTITVHGDVTGATNTSGSIVNVVDDTGLFRITGGAAKISITGALKGGVSANGGTAGLDSGAIYAGLDGSKIGSVTISGGMIGGSGDGSGEVYSVGPISAVSLGDIIGGAGAGSGALISGHAIGTVTITGKGAGLAGAHGIIGQGGAGSGQISAGSTIGSLIVHGSLAGGAGAASGAILSHSITSPAGDVQGNVGGITITGALTGGEIAVAGNLHALSVGGSATGSITAGTAAIAPDGGAIGTLKISGTLSANVAAESIGALSAAGIAGTSSDIVTISATGPGVATHGVETAFGAIVIGSGGVSYANILAGYDAAGSAVNGSASIGKVVDAGNWSESNLVAGVLAGSGGKFGASDASLITPGASIIPQIASIVIKGNVTGSGAGDTYGFVAGKIGAFSVDGVAQSLASKVIDPVGQSTDAVVRIIS